MDPLPAAYLNPDGFLHAGRFHRTTTYGHDRADGPLTVSYAVAGSADPEAPTLVWQNGMGSHRLAACLLDGLCDTHGVRVVTLDRPSAGKSTQVPLEDRVRLSHEALLAVLAAENITVFSILSHSNGIIYALYTLLNLPDHLTVLSWSLSSPWVPPFLSGSTLLSIASWIPTPLTSRLGGLVTGLQKVLGPVDAGLGWSSGVVRGVSEWSSGFVSMGTTRAETPSPRAADATPAGAATAAAAAAEPPEPLTPLKKRDRFRRTNARKPPHKQLFGGEYLPPGLFDEGIRIATAEGLDAMGAEVMMCLRQGAGANWGWVDADAAPDEPKLYERGFERLKTVLAGRGRPLKMSVWYAEDDGLIPQQGREYLRTLLCRRLELVADSDWHTVEDAGHDDTLGRTCVMQPLLEQVVAAHRLD
ncbi:hypothetical protein JCM8202_000304 [Rhodotorula sphaerocarpa]